MRDSRAAQSRLGDADARRHGKKTWSPVCMSHRPCASLEEVVPLCLSSQWDGGVVADVSLLPVEFESSRAGTGTSGGREPVSRLAPRLPDDLDLTTTFL